jgi:hypothetical protein
VSRLFFLLRELNALDSLITGRITRGGKDSGLLAELFKNPKGFPVSVSIMVGLATGIITVLIGVTHDQLYFEALFHEI